VEGLQTTLVRSLRRARPLLFAALGIALLAGQPPPPALVLADAVAPQSAAAEPLPAAIADPTEGYGIAEPGNTLPRSRDTDVRQAWGEIRADLARSGTCWIRSDLGTRLAAAIDANPWLGSRLPCAPTARPTIKVLAILDYFTIWQGQTLCPDIRFSDIYDPRRTGNFSFGDWTLLVRCVAKRFAGRIAAYEIWNEPLLANFQYGVQDGSATNYARLLRIAYREIKAADPQAQVIALGGSDLYAGAGHEDRLARARAFTKELVAAGAPQSADAISLHAYPWGTYGSRIWASYARELAFHADAWQLPVWITETGHRANEPGSQSAYLREAYTLFAAAGVERVFWFALTDQKDGPFGIRARPAQQALRAFIDARRVSGI
jgi:hypothetical protein